MCSHLHSLRDAGTPATQGPPPNNDTVTYSVLQKRHMVRGQSYRKLWGWVGLESQLSWDTHGNEVGNGGSLKPTFHCYN